MNRNAERLHMKTFSQRVLEMALSIPPGRVTTYGRIARAAGGGGQASRSVTGILGKAYDAGEHGIPFHRIVYADGTAWISDDPKRRTQRIALYKKEGIIIGKKDVIENFGEVVMDFK